MILKKVVNGKYDLLPGSGVNVSDFVVTNYPNGSIINFLFVARVMKEKGIDQYLEAAKEIKKRYPNTRFHVCGAYEEEYKGKLDDYVRNGIIEYHGLVQDMKPLYSMASCIVHPTYYPEGLSNVLLESCASGRPIITTDRSGCREVVEDSVNGFIVKQKDSDDLIDKIEKFLRLSNEEREKMGILGRKKIEKEFNRNIVIEKYVKAINS